VKIIRRAQGLTSKDPASKARKKQSFFFEKYLAFFQKNWLVFRNF